VAEAVQEALKAMVILLSPFVPHFCEELWEALGGEPCMTRAAWPSYDPEMLREDEILIVVQVNGKKRAELRLPADTPGDEIKEAALAAENVKRFTEGKTVRKVILVPGKLVNVVAN
jgi:leucyl-tRNA synthetase